MITGRCEEKLRLEPIMVENMGLHNCGENWGILSEHLRFVSTYRCPTCDAPITIEQCSAWPITDQECPHCYQTLTLELSDQPGCTLR